jgi:hypothetical protein
MLARVYLKMLKRGETRWRGLRGEYVGVVAPNLEKIVGQSPGSPRARFLGGFAKESFTWREFVALVRSLRKYELVYCICEGFSLVFFARCISTCTDSESDMGMWLSRLLCLVLRFPNPFSNKLFSHLRSKTFSS